MNLDIIVRAIQEGSFKGTATELEYLKKKAEEVSEEGFKAGEALEKLSGAGRKTDRVAAGDRGAGLASGDPAAAMAELGAASKGLQISREQVDTYSKIEAQLVRVIAAKKLAGKAYEEEMALLTAARAALAPYREEVERTAAALRELKKAQGDEAVETEKGTTNKEKLREIVQGLGATGIPRLATAFRAVVSPIGAAVAAVGGMVVAAGHYIRKVDEMTERTDKFAQQMERVTSMAVMTEQLRAEQDQLNLSIEHTAAALDLVTQKYADRNAEMLLGQRIEQQLSDEKLDTQLKYIEAMKATGAMSARDANLRTLQAQREARARKEERELANIKAAAELKGSEAKAQADEAEAARRKRLGLEPDILKQRRQSELAGKDSQDVTANAQARIDRAREDANILRGLAEGKTFDPKTIAQAIGRVLTPSENDENSWGGVGRPKVAQAELKKREEQILIAQGEIASAKLLEAQEAAILANLEAQRKNLMAIETGAEKGRADAVHAQAQLEKQYEMLLKGRNDILIERKKQQEYQATAEKAAHARTMALQQLDIDIAKLKEEEHRLNKDDARRIGIEDRIAEKERRKREIENYDPSKKPLIDAQNKEEKAAQDEKDRLERQRLFKLQNEGKLPPGGYGASVSFDPAAVNGLASGPVLDITKQIMDAVLKSQAATRGAISELKEKVSELEDRTSEMLNLV